MGRAMADRGHGCNCGCFAFGLYDLQGIGLFQWRIKLIHPREWPAYIRWRIEKTIRRVRQFVSQ
jgi:hypothetical protein